MSLSTGSIIQNITEHFVTIFDDLKNSNLTCSQVLNYYDKSIFVATDSSDGVWKFDIEDENSQESQNII